MVDKQTHGSRKSLGAPVDHLCPLVMLLRLSVGKESDASDLNRADAVGRLGWSMSVLGRSLTLTIFLNSAPDFSLQGHASACHLLDPVPWLNQA